MSTEVCLFDYKLCPCVHTWEINLMLLNVTVDNWPSNWPSNIEISTLLYNVCQCAYLGQLCINQLIKVINMLYFFIYLGSKFEFWPKKIQKPESTPPPTISYTRVEGKHISNVHRDLFPFLWCQFVCQVAFYMDA